MGDAIAKIIEGVTVHELVYLVALAVMWARLVKVHDQVIAASITIENLRRQLAERGEKT